jgi:predicted lipid-binding transport protein (Tim44 family)
MADESKLEDVATAMRQINQAWLHGQVQDLAPLVHPEIVMVSPGFAGRIQGREDLLAGFRDFCQNATIHEFREHDHQVDVTGATAVVTFRYEMVYGRSGKRCRSTGRDLWVFQKQSGTWIAAWRTMLDIEESAA